MKGDYIRDITATLIHNHSTGISYLNFALVLSLALLGFGTDRLNGAVYYYDLILALILITGAIISLGSLIWFLVKRRGSEQSENLFYFKNGIAFSEEEIYAIMKSAVKSENSVLKAYSAQVKSFSKSIQKQFKEIKFVFSVIGLCLLLYTILFIVFHLYF